MSKDKKSGRPVQSMTGYGIANSPGEIELSVEFRGVNGRFLDPTLRLPDELRPFEPALRELLRANIQRGKVELRVSWRADALNETVEPDPQVLAQIQARLSALRRAITDLEQPRASELLNTPGLFGRALDVPSLQPRVMALAGKAITAFIDARVEEGNRIRQMLVDRLTAISQIARMLRERVPELTAVFEQRLTDRLQAVLSTAPGDIQVPPEETMARVRQEVAAYGLRADVAEELDRLQSHVTQCLTLLDGPGPVGKRLDFLMQELNREANTLGSKASAIDLTQAAVDLKVLIEQMREQVQNLE
ncbi:MAG: YicC/YloC family endoribonuclease [Burkholderiaceae bacterium]